MAAFIPALQRVFVKILLIQPPYDLFPDDERQAMPPLGLAYIAAVLERDGHDVRIIDCVAEGFDNLQPQADGRRRCGLQGKELQQLILDFEPHIVGVSCLFTAQAKSAYDVCRLVKSTGLNITTVMGGAHPSAVPQEVLSVVEVDAVCIGEGEMVMARLAKELEQENTPNIPGLYWRVHKDKFRTAPPDVVRDLDELPLPARHLLPMHLYFKHKAPHGGIVRRNPCTNVITSRGCPARCSFCSIHTVWGRKFRSHSSKWVLDELESLVKEYGVREIQFEDDNITLNKKRMIEICEGMIERKLDLLWTTPNGVALWALDEQLINLMRRAGCYHITIAVESGSPRVLKEIIGKPIDLVRVPNIVKACKKAGMNLSAMFVVGFPGETREEIQQTFDYAMNMGADAVHFFTATPYPGTKLFKECVEKKLIPLPVNPDTLRIGQPVISTSEWTAEELGKMVRTAQGRFYLHMAVRNPFRFIYAFACRFLREPRGMFNRIVGLGAALVAKPFQLINRSKPMIASTTGG